jgi:hypothetical protein
VRLLLRTAKKPVGTWSDSAISRGLGLGGNRYACNITTTTQLAICKNSVLSECFVLNRLDTMVRKDVSRTIGARSLNEIFRLLGTW